MKPCRMNTSVYGYRYFPTSILVFLLHGINTLYFLTDYYCTNLIKRRYHAEHVYLTENTFRCFPQRSLEALGPSSISWQETRLRSTFTNIRWTGWNNQDETSKMTGQCQWRQNIGVTIPWQVVFRYEICRISWNLADFMWKLTDFMYSFLLLSQIGFAVIALLKEEEFVHTGDQTWHCCLIISRPLQ